MWKWSSAVAAAAFLSFGSAPAAYATIIPVPDAIFTFTGQCAPNDCASPGIGTLTLLPGYMQGTSINESNFVSFTYSSNLLNISFTGIGVGVGLTNSVQGDMTNLPGPAFFEISGVGQEFVSEVSGTWCAGSNCLSDNGTVSSWSVSATPLPATLPLFAGGLGFVGYLARRKKGNAPAVSA